MRRGVNAQIASESFAAAELADYLGGIAMLAVNCFIHGAHVVRGDSSGQGIESRLDLRPSAQRFIPDERNGLVGREIMLVVLEHG